MMSEKGSVDHRNNRDSQLFAYFYFVNSKNYSLDFILGVILDYSHSCDTFTKKEMYFHFNKIAFFINSIEQ